MRRTIALAMVAPAVLWLALPAAAQFEINPDHFENATAEVMKPHSRQSKGTARAHRGLYVAPHAPSRALSVHRTQDQPPKQSGSDASQVGRAATYAQRGLR